MLRASIRGVHEDMREAVIGFSERWVPANRIAVARGRDAYERALTPRHSRNGLRRQRSGSRSVIPVEMLYDRVNRVLAISPTDALL